MIRARMLRWLEALLIATGFFLLGWWCHGWTESRRFQESAMQSLEQRRAAFADLEKPATKKRAKQAIPARSVIGRIDIPRLKISAVIVEGTEPDVLDKAVGHFTTTALPGEAGNFALAGHRDTFLRGLGGIRHEDVVLISTPDRTLRYVVEASQVVGPERIDVLNPTPRPTLTLVTCYPFTFVGPAPERFVVRAALAENEGAQAR